MYVPAPPAQPAVALAPVSIVSTRRRSQRRRWGARDTTCRCASAQLNVLDGHRHRHRHRRARPAAGRAGRTVALQALGRHGWSTCRHAHTAAKGRFRLQLRAAPDRQRARAPALRAATPLGLPSHRRLGQLNVYRLAEASWYGGGGGLACGGSLTSATLGVANKTLPCGTLVTLRYGGHSVRVPVVDRGPYVAGREFDLTEATKQALGFGDTGEVWSTR